MSETTYFRARVTPCECDELAGAHVGAMWLYGDGSHISEARSECHPTREAVASAAVGYDGWHSPSFDGDYIMALRSV